MDTITLHVDICDQGRGYRVTFEGPRAEDMAVAFISGRITTHAFSEVRDAPFPNTLYPRLTDTLYPKCEHGGPLDLCEGPQHYGYDDHERRAYGF